MIVATVQRRGLAASNHRLRRGAFHRMATGGPALLL